MNTFQIIFFVMFVFGVVWYNADILARIFTPTQKNYTFEDNIIVCECGHQLEEHDWNGCSVMTVECKPHDFSRVTACHCKLTPQDIVEGINNG